MLLKAGQIVQSATPLLCQSLAGARFSRASFHTTVSKIDPKLLYPFNKDKMLLAMDAMQDQANPLYNKDMKDVVVLDKLSQTVSSETHRVFDKYEKKFFAVKTLNLDSDNSWKQLNLILRQQEMNYSSIQKFSHLNYDHAGKEAKIITEIQKNVLSEGLMIQRAWTTNELRTLTLHLLRQMNSLKELGAYCHYIKPEHIFADQVSNTLKLFDFSGFEIKSENPFWGFSPSLNFDATIVSLVKIIDPFAAVNQSEEAQIYIQRKYPQFYQELNQIKAKANSLSSWDRRHSFDRAFNEYDSLSSNPTVFHTKEYDQQNLNKIKQSVETKNLSNFDEVWGNINQGFDKHGDAAHSFHKSLDKNIAHYGQTHEITCRSYLNLAEAYKAMGQTTIALDYFRKAINLSYSVPNMDGLTVARLYNEYGKLLKEQNKLSDSYDCFKKAEKALMDSGVSHPSFAKDIANNLNATYQSSKPTGNIFDDFSDAWRETASHNYQTWQTFFKKHDMNGAERFAARMNHFGENMIKFGKRMETMGAHYHNYNWNAWKHDWNAYAKKYHDPSYYQRHSWWNPKGNATAEQTNNSSNQHPRGFMGCFRNGWRYNHHHHHHHRAPHWNWSQSYSSYRPGGCGYFPRTRRFFRIMFKVTFYMIMFSIIAKIWRKTMKSPQTDERYQVNSQGMIEKTEKKPCWSFFGHYKKDKDNEQNDWPSWSYMSHYHRRDHNQADGSAAPAESRSHRWNRRCSREDRAVSEPVAAAAPADARDQAQQPEVLVEESFNRELRSEDQRGEDVRDRVERRGFGFFGRHRREEQNEQRDQSQFDKEFEDWKDRRRKWRRSRSHSEEPVKSEAPVEFEIIQKEEEKIDEIPRREVTVVRKETQEYQPRNVDRHTEQTQVHTAQKPQYSREQQINKEASFREQSSSARQQTSALPKETKKVMDVPAALNENQESKEKSTGWMLFGLTALISTIGLSL